MTTLDFPNRMLLGPGPSNVSSRVLEALSKPTVGHLDPFFLELMDGLRGKLRTLFGTANEMTLAMSGTGSLGMETLFSNLVEPGDKVLVCQNGVFGGRMADVARRVGGVVDLMETKWGVAFDQQQIIDKITVSEPRVIAIVHAETSTGVWQAIDQLSEAAHRTGALLLVDCVTSLGGMKVAIDEWGVDAAYSGTQKCLSCPPGLAPITLSPRAVEKLEKRKTPPVSWYADLALIRNYWGGARVYHHTAPVNMLYALDEALNIVLEEGLTNAFERHRSVHKCLRLALIDLGFSYIPREECSLPMLNAVKLPSAVAKKKNEGDIRKRLLLEHNIEIGGGLGQFQGKAWRIGLMGHSANEKNVERLLSVLPGLLA